MAIEADAVEARPRLYIQWQDAVPDCREVPGFVCALGTEEDPDTMFRGILKNDESLDRIAHWMAVFEETDE